MVEESADHCSGAVVEAPRGASCFSPRPCTGVGLGVGAGVGAAGGWVTKVIVCAELRGWPAAVLAPEPMVTWYWVFGASVPALGVTARVFASQEKVTLVAGVMLTASCVAWWSIGWLKATRIGCCSATPLLPSIGLATMTCCRPPAGCSKARVTTDAIRTRPTAAPAHARPGGWKARRHHESRRP